MTPRKEEAEINALKGDYRSFLPVCPICKKPVILKKKEPYKLFFMCATTNCDVMSIIITSSIKEWEVRKE